MRVRKLFSKKTCNHSVSLVHFQKKRGGSIKWDQVSYLYSPVSADELLLSILQA